MLTAAPVLQHQSDLVLFRNSLRANRTLALAFSIPRPCERDRVCLGRIRVDHVRRHPRSEEDNDLGKHRLRNLHDDLDRSGTRLGQRPKGLWLRCHGECSKIEPCGMRNSHRKTSCSHGLSLVCRSSSSSSTPRLRSGGSVSACSSYPCIARVGS